MKKSIYILEPLVVYIISHDIIQFLLYMIVNRIAAQENAVQVFLKRDAAYVTSGVQILSMLLGMLGLIAFERFIMKRRSVPAKMPGMGKGEQPGRGKEYKVGFFKGINAADWKKYCVHTGIAVLQMLLIAFSLNVIMLNTGFSKMAGSFAEISSKQAGMPVIMAVLLFGIVSPLVEEYVFRGMLYVRLKELFPVPLSIGISALFFGIYHGNLVQGIYGFLMGAFLAYIYEANERAGLPFSLSAVILCHALANLLIYFSGRLELIGRTPVYAGVVLLVLALVSVYFCNWLVPSRLRASNR